MQQVPGELRAQQDSGEVKIQQVSTEFGVQGLGFRGLKVLKEVWIEGFRVWGSWVRDLGERSRF